VNEPLLWLEQSCFYCTATRL